MAETEMARLNEMLRERIRLENEISERVQEVRRRSEQDYRNTISGLEANVQTAQRRIFTLETQLQEARDNQQQRAESDAERIRTLREEIAASRRDTEQERTDRRADCLRLQNEVSARERSLAEAERENLMLKERLDRIERQVAETDETIPKFREENANLRADRTRLEIQMTDAERQYTERITELERMSLGQEQELRDLNDRFDAVMNLIQHYLRGNTRRSMQLGRLRESLDHIYQQQTNDAELLERDLDRFNRRRFWR